MFEEYDVIRLRSRTSTIPLPPETKGTILLIHAATPPAYEVEFVDDAGESLGTFTAHDEDLALETKVET